MVCGCWCQNEEGDEDADEEDEDAAYQPSGEESEEESSEEDSDESNWSAENEDSGLCCFPRSCGLLTLST